ncbi:MAG TPA: ThuA domain-containing protein, partial [Bryobacteraceae bacterium]|nr:ThuA domain-containing protein [Bryobacteraceae bacterium]
MIKERFGWALLAVLCGCLLLGAQQAAPPSTPPRGGRAQGQPGGRGGRGGRPAGRKVVLAWADTRNGIAQHDSVSHALATIERLGYESGLWDTYIRTDSNIASYHPLMTTGQAASGGPSFNNVDAIFFMGHREVPLDDQQKTDLLKFVHDEGKGFVAAHVALTALMAWPEFGEMLGG